MKRLLLCSMLFLAACGSGTDGGSPDSGGPDSGMPDSGTPDSGMPDSGTPDSGTPTHAPSAPSGVTASATSMQARVSWSAPSDTGGGAIDSYTVTASPADSVMTVPSDDTSVDMVDLKNGTAYTFTVVANNAVGSSAASSPSSSVTPLSLPGTPHDALATRGNGSATVSFTPPTDTGGTPLTAYVATANPGGATGTAGPLATSVTVSGLSNGTAYTFTLVAQNAKGSSIASGRTNQVIPSSAAATAPQAPVGLGAIPGDGSADVFWSAPDNGGSLITGYTVTASPGGQTATATAPSTWAHVTGLANGTSYTFKVVAANGVGSSTASSASNAVTPSASGTACASAANTSPSGVEHNGCALLQRDTSGCQAAREAQGLSGFWLKFSCRVTLTATTYNGQPAVELVSDTLPDYTSTYFADTDACHSYDTPAFPDPNAILTHTLDLTVPLTPGGSGQSIPGLIGMALNGVSIFSNVAAPGDDIYTEANSFDECRGHPNQTSYHYHSEPYSISYDDDAFIGVMRDGVPVYGRRDPDGSLPVLDSHGGHLGVTVDSPSTPVYHYHTNLQTSSTAGTAGTAEWFLSTGSLAYSPGACTACN